MNYDVAMKFTVDGNPYTYLVKSEYEYDSEGVPDTMKMSHIVVDPSGEKHELDWSPYDRLNKEDLIQMVKLGFPDREQFNMVGPLNHTVIHKKSVTESEKKLVPSFLDFLAEYTYSGHRNPKTTQEKRANSGSEMDDAEPRVRPKRNRKNLPSTYDDLPKNDDRSWKRHRKAQFKLKEGYELYHDSYTSAIQTAKEIATSRGYVIDDDEAFRVIGSGPRKPAVGETNDLHLRLYDKDGKQKREALHFQVYNRGGDKRPYELNAYIS